MRMSAQGRAWLTREEGYRAKAYRDSAGHWTIGIGHLIRDDERHLLTATLTRQEAEDLLTHDLAPFEDVVNKTIQRPLNQAQFDALVSLAFNIGAGAFRKSTVARRINEGQPVEKVGEAWQWWANKQPELLPRRKREVTVYTVGMYAAILLYFCARAALLLAFTLTQKP